MRRTVTRSISLPLRLDERLTKDHGGNVSKFLCRLVEAHYGRTFDEVFIADGDTIGYPEAMQRWGYSYATLRKFHRRFGAGRGRLDRATFERYAKNKPERHGPQDQTDAGAL
jgi:hypothetical protein